MNEARHLRKWIFTESHSVKKHSWDQRAVPLSHLSIAIHVRWPKCGSGIKAETKDFIGAIFTWNKLGLALAPLLDSSYLWTETQRCWFPAGTDASTPIAFLSYWSAAKWILYWFKGFLTGIPSLWSSNSWWPDGEDEIIWILNMNIEGLGFIFFKLLYLGIVGFGV